MARWALFTAVAGVLTVLLLLLARQSQKLLERQSASTEPGDRTAEEQLHPPAGTVADRVDAETQPETVAGDQTATVHRDGDSEFEADPIQGVENREPGEQPRQSNLGPDIELTSSVLFANVAMTQGLVIVFLVAAAWYFEIPASAFGVAADPASTGLPALLLGAVFGVVLWLGNELSTTVADAVGASYDEAVRETMAPESAGGWLVLFAVVLPIIAAAEELLFRGALIGVPAAGFSISPWLLAIVASLAFALGHGAQGRVGIVVTGVLGFVLAAGYIVSGSLVVVIVAHYAINGLEFFVHEYLGVEALFG